MEKPLEVLPTLTDRELRYVMIYVASRLKESAEFEAAFAEGLELARDND